MRAPTLQKSGACRRSSRSCSAPLSPPASPFTGGEDGIQAVPRGKLFGLIDLANQTNMYFTVLVIFLGSFLIIYRIINSPFGEVLKAIRENEARAVSLGYKTDRYKLVAFVLSPPFPGVAGQA